MTSSDSTWIAVDWGTSNLRVWRMSRDGEVLSSVQSDRGMGQLSPQDFEMVLLDLIAVWLVSGQTDVVICGMAGARGGWIEAPYRTLPWKPSKTAAISPLVNDLRIRVFILPGLSQTDPPDVMRGEETQVAGLLVNQPNFTGVMCLPGTHCKWVDLVEGQVRAFRTFMTGELFALLSTQSILSKSPGEEWDKHDFHAGVERGMASSEGLSADLFALRAGPLLGHHMVSWRAWLSGYLTGLELAAARQFWSKGRVVVVGQDHHRKQYGVLSELGAAVEFQDAEALTVAGLAQARDILRQE